MQLRLNLRLKGVRAMFVTKVYKIQGMQQLVELPQGLDDGGML